MRSSFLKMLWGSRREPPSPAVQERIAQWTTTYPRHGNVQAAPKDPPIRRGGGFRNG